MKHLNVYICSSIRGFKQKHGAYGYVLEYVSTKGPVTLTRFREIENATKNLSLLIALNEALDRINEKCELDIYTDSNYIKQGLESWNNKWQQNGFVTQKGSEIANRNDWECLIEQISNHDYNVFNCNHEYTAWMESEVLQAEIRGINKYGKAKI